jgi:hypothetical protein
MPNRYSTLVLLMLGSLSLLLATPGRLLAQDDKSAPPVRAPEKPPAEPAKPAEPPAEPPPPKDEDLAAEAGSVEGPVAEEAVEPLPELPLLETPPGAAPPTGLGAEQEPVGVPPGERPEGEMPLVGEPEAETSSTEPPPVDKPVAPPEKRSAYERCGDGPEGPEWLDKFGYGVYRTVCASATWLDNFFGGDRGLRERDTSYGRVGVGLSWDEFNGTEAKFRFKAKVQFPRAENRFNAFFGRFEEDEFVRGQVDDVGSVPAIFRETQEKDWLLGFGYNPVRSVRTRIDFDAGVKVKSPLETFVKGTWRYYLFMNERSLLRVAQTVFYTNHLEFGTTTRLDAEQVLADNLHLRWQGLATAAQETEGVDWRSSLIVYQNLGGLRAIAYEAEVEGETDAPVALEQYGLRAIYRQRFLRDDLFFELQGRLFWPKSVDQPEREATPGIGIGFEMLWGDQPKLFGIRIRRASKS